MIHNEFFFGKAKIRKYLSNMGILMFYFNFESPQAQKGEHL